MRPVHDPAQEVSICGPAGPRLPTAAACCP